MSVFSRRNFLVFGAVAFVSACGGGRRSSRPEKLERSEFNPPLYPNETPELRALINKYAAHYELPTELLHKLAIRESTHRPWAVNRPYYGMLQILPATARSMGYKGSPDGLLDAETNLIYAGKYLRGAWLVSGGDIDEAIGWYAKGYYYEAKRLGLLEETGLKS
ncbi:Transglycosylase SLT domain protein [Shimia thalassica]|uniref:Transglycosylase SLT domain protein n=1 Tax=Shimia thalassica TaxID=1715693 RepID=A0A0P1I6S2_9RHOB|nr:lytic transglycosylase domain-containing protein [Shimia thalassica]CUJ93756.1 Transglycosylase SLT domain protein [Shimia thalassica]